MAQHSRNSLALRIIITFVGLVVCRVSANAQFTYRNFDYGIDREFRSGAYYEINPFTGQPQRHHAGDNSAVREMADSFVVRYARVDARAPEARLEPPPEAVGSVGVTSEAEQTAAVAQGAQLEGLQLQEDIAGITAEADVAGPLTAVQPVANVSTAEVIPAAAGELQIIVGNAPKEGEMILVAAAP